MAAPSHPLRALPSVDVLLATPAVAALAGQVRRDVVVAACRRVLEVERSRLRTGRDPQVEEPAARPLAALAGAVHDDVARLIAPRLGRVVNATGTVLHTNLGRACLSEAAVAAVVEAARHPVNLEYDLATGRRGHRESLVEAQLLALTGAEAATVVNNNAAAVLLALNTLAVGRDVVVSRGELVEIGGAFRVPAIMQKSGARLREVGTTNRTHPSDYEQAIDGGTALLLKVHTSNYRVVGFTSEVDLPSLTAIGRRRGVPVMEDLGSGALVDLSAHGLPKEPVVAERIGAGADVVTFSGDKVLGGPQCGIVVGRRVLIDQLRSNPLHRALRCDKLTLAALGATLAHYLGGSEAADVPALAAFIRPAAAIEAVAVDAAARLRAALGAGYTIDVRPSLSEVGSGALPTEGLPTFVVAIGHGTRPAEAIAAAFRTASPPVIGRIHDGTFLLDARLVHDAGELVPSWAVTPIESSPR